MTINPWAFALLLVCAIFVLVWYVIPFVLRLLVALMGLVFHVKAAKTYGVPVGPIVAMAPHHLLRAFQSHNIYTATLRAPDINFNYRTGAANVVTNNERWLTELASALSHGRTNFDVTVFKNGRDLNVNEAMGCKVEVLPGNSDFGPMRVLVLHPMSNIVESVLGFDMAKLIKTVKHYTPEVEAVVVFDPRSLIDGKWNTIAYLSALDGSLYGTWYDQDHLMFKIDKGQK